MADIELVIKIPKEFETDFDKDKFADCFGRIIADIDYSLHHAEYMWASRGMCAGKYEKETMEMLMGAFVNGTPLPKGHGRLIDANAINIHDISPIYDLDKIRAEIERQEKWLLQVGYNAYNVDIAFSSIKLAVDKCKTESVTENGTQS